jgi:hypothetical protein
MFDYIKNIDGVSTQSRRLKEGKAWHFIFSPVRHLRTAGEYPERRKHFEGE